MIVANKILSVVGLDHDLKAIIVAFRGSANLKNWLTDANIFKADYHKQDDCKKCAVHKGFQNSYVKQVAGGLSKAIEDALAGYP